MVCVNIFNHLRLICILIFQILRVKTRLYRVESHTILQLSYSLLHMLKPDYIGLKVLEYQVTPNGVTVMLKPDYIGLKVFSQLEAPNRQNMLKPDYIGLKGLGLINFQSQRPSCVKTRLYRVESF